MWSLAGLAPQQAGFPTRVAVTPPPSVTLDPFSGLAVSPDGRTVVFLDSSWQMYRRSLDQLDAVPIPGTVNAWAPFFSPNGEWVGYFDRGDSTLKKVRPDGSQAVTLCPITSNLLSASWGPDDAIVFSSGASDALQRVPASGGEPEPLWAGAASPPRDTVLRWVDLLPDGRAALASVGGEPGLGLGGETHVVVVSLDTGEREVLLAGTSPRYASSGHIIYWHEGSLWAVPFDADQRVVTGPSTPVLEGVAIRSNGLANFATGGTSLVYDPGTAAVTSTLVWVDRDGNEELVAAEPRPYTEIRLSPDGGRVALVVNDPDNSDLIIYDLARDTPTRFTFDPGRDQMPSWTPDGERVAFASTRDDGMNIYWKAADGTGQVEPLTSSETFKAPGPFLPDGMTLIFAEGRPGTQIDIGTLSLDGDHAVEWFLEGETGETFLDLSPDGRWIVYLSNESGQDEVYVQPFPNVDDGRWQLSQDGGVSPLWGPDSREVFFLTVERPGAPVTLMAAVNDTEPTFTPGIPRPLFDGPYRLGGVNRSKAYDVSPDGQRFLMIKEITTSEPLVLVQNWVGELTRLVPVP